MLVSADPTSTPGDGRIGAALTAPEGSTASRMAGHVSALGSVGGVALCAGVLAVFCWWRTHDARLTGLCVLVPAVAAVVQWLVKELVHRRAPGHDAPASALAFPSGHTTGAWAVAVTAVFVAFVALPQGRLRRAAVAVVIVGAVVVSVARVVEGAHYATDVVAGALLGCSVAFVGAAVVSGARR